MISFSERTMELGYNKGMQQGVQQGRQQGMQQATYEMIIKMYKKGMSIDQIADLTDIDIADISSIIADK